MYTYFISYANKRGFGNCILQSKSLIMDYADVDYAQKQIKLNFNYDETPIIMYFQRIYKEVTP